MTLIDDIYYQRSYVELYKKDVDSIFEFKYKELDSYFYNISIKRPITEISGLRVDEGYYDLETAYGYGGFLTNSDDSAFISRAMTSYRDKCLDERIIAEFIRFHPFNKFPVKYNQYFDFNIHDRDVVITPSCNYDDVRRNYKGSLKRNIRKASEYNLDFNFIYRNKIDYVDEFYNLYIQTMKGNDANEFYFFEKKYFENIFRLDECLLFVVRFYGQIVNMVLMLKGEGVWYYHLGATDQDFYYLNGNAFIFDKIIKSACDSGCNFYLGGGATSLVDDLLYVYKKKFSSEIMPFYISGKVYDHNVYNRYIDIYDGINKSDVRYFLKYRL